MSPGVEDHPGKFNKTPSLKSKVHKAAAEPVSSWNRWKLGSVLNVHFGFSGVGRQGRIYPGPLRNHGPADTLISDF